MFHNSNNIAAPDSTIQSESTRVFRSGLAQALPSPGLEGTKGILGEGTVQKIGVR